MAIDPARSVQRIPDSSYFRINDIIFDIPPEYVQIVKNDFNAAASTLRSRTTTRVKSGRRKVTFIVKTTFAKGSNSIGGSTTVENWINQQLAPVLTQVRKCPFVSIENEKIRKEMVGEGAETIKKNMAAVVKSIDVKGNAREGEVVHVTFTMEWFNFTPYSSNFLFKETVNGNSVASPVPGQPFREFYQSGTVDGDGKLLNSINPSSDGSLSFYFKQYYKIEGQNPDLKDILYATSDRIELEREDVKTMIGKSSEGGVVGRLNQVIQSMERLGWKVEKDAEVNGKEAVVLMSRYKKFTISESILLESGALITEGFSFRLSTKVPSIPLLGHTMPTAQFLGVADSELSFTIFANANTAPYSALGLNQSGDKAIGTSSKLAYLNKVFEMVNRNAVTYRLYSKSDSIYVDYKFARLFKYQQYNDNIQDKKQAYNTETGRLEEFNPNLMIPCMLENTVSETVQGHPFCSRMTIQMTENERVKNSTVRNASQGGTNRVYEATFDVVNKLASRYGIARGGSPALDFNVEFGRPTGPQNGFGSTKFPDKYDFKELQLANDLATKLNANLSIKEYKTAKEAIYDTAVIENEKYNDKWFLNYKSLNNIASGILKMIAASPEKYPDYKDIAEPMLKYNLITDDTAYPDMMLPLDNPQPDHAWYNESEEEYTEETEKFLLQKAWTRRIDAGVSFAENFNTPSPKIEKEVEGGSTLRKGEWASAPAINPHLANNGKEKAKSDSNASFAQIPTDEAQQRNIVETAVLRMKDQTYKMRRSMPTFKLYFLDSEFTSITDLKPSEIKRASSLWRNFADFYDLNGIVDIRLAKDEGNPSDTLIIRMTNTREDIINKAFQSSDRSVAEAIDLTQKIRKTKNPKRLRELKSEVRDGVMLREGTRIELRLGHDADPNKLPVEFIGRVASLGGGDVIEIVCQGDGVELIQELKGVGVSEEYDYRSNTPDIISNLIHGSEEIKNFGTTVAKTSIGDLPFLWRSAGGRTAVDNVFAPSLFNLWDTATDTAGKYAAWGGVIGTFIPIPGVGTLTGTLVGAALGFLKAGFQFVWNGSPFYIYEQTVWSVLQELTLRHPGLICGVVPYDRRSTIFFGYPDQLYFFRGPTVQEILATGDISSFGIRTTQRELLDSKFGKNNVTQSSREELKALAKNEDVKEGEFNPNWMKSFRDYHLITSEHDIIDNSMMVTTDGVYNAIEVVYPNTTDQDEINVDGSAGFSEYETYDTIQADDDLDKEFIKKKTMVFHNASTNMVEDLPERYAVASLCKSLQGVYKGKITILGKSGIKPHDVVFLEDSYNGISGPIKVSKVTHVFSYDTGWVTEIHPAMLVFPSGTTEGETVKTLQHTAKYYALRNKLKYHKSFGVDIVDQEERRQMSAVNTVAEALGGTVPDVAAAGLTAMSARRAYESTQFAKQALANGGGFAGFKSTTEFIGEGIVNSAKLKGGRLYKDFTGVLASGNTTNIIKNKATLQGASNTFAKGVGIGKSAAGGLGSTAKFALKTAKWGIAGLVLDYTVGFYISWSKQRQPIAFLPVHRNGKAWYTALDGFNNNTETEAIGKKWEDTKSEVGFYLETLGEDFGITD